MSRCSSYKNATRRSACNIEGGWKANLGISGGENGRRATYISTRSCYAATARLLLVGLRGPCA